MLHLIGYIKYKLYVHLFFLYTININDEAAADQERINNSFAVAVGF
jgi:hypothetical protein